LEVASRRRLLVVLMQVVSALSLGLSYAPTHSLTLAVFVVWALSSRRLLVVLMQVVSALSLGVSYAPTLFFASTLLSWLWHHDVDS
jgi:hypothetical protein